MLPASMLAYEVHILQMHHVMMQVQIMMYTLLMTVCYSCLCGSVVAALAVFGGSNRPSTGTGVVNSPDFLVCCIWCAAFPDRPEEYVPKDSRRIWRKDQVKREYWHQRAAVFLQSQKRAWVLKTCYWDWQMSSQSDYLLHKQPGAHSASSC